MKYFFNCLPEIKKKMREGKNCILMFDFDGTLSKIAKTPKDAYLKKSTRDLLKKLSKDFYIAVISGRALFDVKSKVGLPNLIYAGNHGFEWQIGAKKQSAKISPGIRKKLLSTKKNLRKLIAHYPGAFLEDKLSTLSVHFRLLDKKNSRSLIQKIISVLRKEKSLRAIKGKKVIEIRPKINWNKGTFVKFLVKYLEKKNHCHFATFYVGDDKTDEDAFKALRKGITVRVGKKKQSSADYFVKASEINKLLLQLVRE
ncbi:MAG: trehalose-phosphatase [Candidatus Staskawiczbacteria bacterium]|nr:trehalose-phosphatase [Candidatus Staskawiczbacteria bacterium]